MVAHPVLHLRQGTHIWGPERQIMQLTEGLRDSAFKLETIVFYRGAEQHLPPLAEAIKSVGGRADAVDASWSALPSVTRHLVKRLRSGGIRLVHTHEYKSHLIGGLAARRAGVAWIASDHGLYTGASLSLKLYRTMEEVALRKAARVIVPSPYQRDQLQARGVSPERIAVIQHGIDAARFAGSGGHGRSVTRQAIGTDSQAVVLLAVGRLEPVKGHRFLIEALPTIRRAYPDAEVWLAGEGFLRPQLERRAATLGVHDAVRFLGYRSDVADLMIAADIVAIPSLVETFGIVALEALALARPVVAADVGGLRETVTDGETGWLVPPACPSALAEVVLEILENGDEMERRGKRGKVLVQERFAVETMIERMRQLYSEVLTCPNRVY